MSAAITKRKKPKPKLSRLQTLIVETWIKWHSYTAKEQKI